VYLFYAAVLLGLLGDVRFGRAAGADPARDSAQREDRQRLGLTFPLAGLGRTDEVIE